MEKGLSSDEVLHIAEGRPSSDRLKHSQQFKFFTYDQLRGQPAPAVQSAYVILFRERPDFGHFCCLINHGSTLEFFDPYGLKPDREKAWYSDQINQSLDQEDNYLSQMMRNYPGSLEFNEVPLQDKNNRRDQTCGRHVGFRCFLIKDSLADYQAFMKEAREEGIKPSELVTVLTDIILRP